MIAAFGESLVVQGKTWDDAVGEWLSEKSAKRSLDSDKGNIRWLNRFLSGIPLVDIDRNVINVLVQKKIESGVSNATVNRMLALLRGVLNAAVNDWEWLGKRPKIRLLAEPSRRIRFLSQAQARRLLTELPPHLSDMAAFSLATGLRRSNVMGLRWHQIDIVRQRADFSASEMKSGKQFVIPLNHDAMRILLLRKGGNSEFVFTYKGERIKQVTTAAWYKALDRAGIADFRWHDLRHTWASWHVQRGTPLLALQELGGWESTEMVRRYAHFSDENLFTFASNIPNLIEPS